MNSSFNVVFDQKRNEVHEDKMGDLFDVGFGNRAVGLEDVRLCRTVIAVAEGGNGKEDAHSFSGRLSVRGDRRVLRCRRSLA